MTRAEIIEAFGLLDDVLEKNGCEATLYLVGGAVMSLTYRRPAPGITEDVDALRIEGDDMERWIQQVADLLDLSPDWLNDEVKRVAPPIRKDLVQETLYEGSCLVVTGASPEYILALKARAARMKDAPDIAVLMKQVGIEDCDAVLAVHDSIFPRHPLGASKRTRLEELVRQIARDE